MTIHIGEHHVVYQYSFHNAKNHYVGWAQTETVSWLSYLVQRYADQITQPYFQPNPAAPAPFISNSAYNDPAGGPGGQAWALSVVNSQNLLFYGAGFYSFFQNYQTTCQGSANCQQQIINLDSASTVSVYLLSTVGVINSLSVNAQAVIHESDNQNGFQQTVGGWTRT